MLSQSTKKGLRCGRFMKVSNGSMAMSRVAPLVAPNHSASHVLRTVLVRREILADTIPPQRKIRAH